MSQLDALLARSREPAIYKNRRHFTLSREKAIEKQREFALRDPRFAVLELIQGAIFAGASYLAVDTRTQDVLVAWVGAPPLRREELENIFDYLFASRADPAIRHLVQLAVGLNALLQQRPRSIRLESGAGSCVRLELRPDGEASIGEVESPIDGTYIVAEFGGGFFSRFRWSTPPAAKVASLIEERCLYTPVPILLNGRAPFGFRAYHKVEIFGAHDQQAFDDGERRGVVAIHDSARVRQHYRIVVGGVWITDLRLEELASVPLVGVICDDGLRKTADHAAIVQSHDDPAYVRMLHGVQPHATALIRRSLDRSYNPPPLPPLVDAKSREEGEQGVARAPVPDPIPMVGPRGTTSVERLGTLGEEPVFWCTPEVAERLERVRSPHEGAASDPYRFPFLLLRLTEPEANQLSDELPGLALHRLTAPADIDFILRVMERGVEYRKASFDVPGGRVEVRLHLRGHRPAWGNGREGVPILVRDGARTIATGVIQGSTVSFHDGSDEELEVDLCVPRLSIVYDSDGRRLGSDVVRVVRGELWRMAVPVDGTADPELLAALLGQEARPQFAQHPSGEGVCLGAALPPDWPARLRVVPLVETADGPLDFDGFLRLVESGGVAQLPSVAMLRRMEPLERSFGFGHLAVPGADDLPLFAVARIGGRWSWVGRDAFFRESQPFSHLVYVAPHFGVRTEDRELRLLERPEPELVAVGRRDAGPIDLDEGWRSLYKGLRRLELENAWESRLTAERLARGRSLGRLALLHLALRVEEGTRDPLLLPSDGGARWSIERLRSDPEVRVTASNGVKVVEPKTFCLSFAAYRALAPDGELRLRYDDLPEVWHSLGETSDEGWLLRTEVAEGRLRGWLGLRMPYDASCGILLRTTGNLVALPELERSIPCHGLLWPTRGSEAISDAERQFLRFAGLRMYAQLLRMLQGRLDPERARAARLYAWGFCYRAHLRGPLAGTALQLARRVEVLDENGRVWGTLERWLDTAVAGRPPPPQELVLPAPEKEERPTPDRPDRSVLEVIERRFRSVLPPGLDTVVQLRPMGRNRVAEVGMYGVERNARFPFVVPGWDRGSGVGTSGSALAVRLNETHPLVRDALDADGPARELLLLEMARQLAVWSEESMERKLTLVDLHQRLLVQRIGDGG